jgi:hypothetical protein
VKLLAVFKLEPNVADLDLPIGGKVGYLEVAVELGLCAVNECGFVREDPNLPPPLVERR